MQPEPIRLFRAAQVRHPASELRTRARAIRHIPILQGSDRKPRSRHRSPALEHILIFSSPLQHDFAFCLQLRAMATISLWALATSLLRTGPSISESSFHNLHGARGHGAIDVGSQVFTRTLERKSSVSSCRADIDKARRKSGSGTSRKFSNVNIMSRY